MISPDILKTVRRIEIRTRRRVNHRYAGPYHSVFKGRGMEFNQVRPYAPGDQVREIDWNVTARMGHPYVKTYVEERELTVVLAADVSASHRFGSRSQLKRGLVAEMVAVLALTALRNHDRVGLLLFSQSVERYIAPARGTSHALRLVREALCHETPGRGTRLCPALDFVNRITPRRAVVFLVSDFLYQDDPIPKLRSTARRHDLVAIRVSDRLEQRWPHVGVVEWQDLETGRRRLLDTGSARVRNALAAEVAHRDEARRIAFRGMGVDLVDVETGRPYDRALMRFFRERERRMRV